MKLIYTGKTIEEVGVVPLPEGWPTADHEEPDKALAKEKIASGNYRAAGKDEKPEEGE